MRMLPILRMDVIEMTGDYFYLMYSKVLERTKIYDFSNTKLRNISSQKISGGTKKTSILKAHDAIAFRTLTRNAFR